MSKKVKKQCRRKSYVTHVRAGPGLVELIRVLRMKDYEVGRRPRSARQITDLLANRYMKEELYNDKYLKL